MSGLPWTSHPAHVGGHDEGGMEHLETDVMRFMAILAFCLVAIFALVQSIPIPLDTPAPPDASPVVAQALPVEPAPVEIKPPEPTTPAPVAVAVAKPSQPDAPTRSEEKVALPPPLERLVMPVRTAPPRRKQPEQVALVVPEPKPLAPPVTQQTEPVVEPVSEPAPAPQPAPVAAAPAAAPEPPPTSTPESAQKGFSLRFDSDAALRQLVARDEVALYAITGKKAWRVMMVNERLSFRPAQSPARFHEMAAATVPNDVVKTLRRLVTVSPDQLTWGVTLPASTSRQLSEFLSAYDSGGLVIDASGGLRLEQG